MYVNTENAQEIYRSLWTWNLPGYLHFLHHFSILSLFKNNKHILIFEKRVRGYLMLFRQRKGRLCGRTFWVQGDEGDVVPDVLTSWLSTGGNGVTGLGPALPVLIVAVFLPGYLHHNGVLPTPGNRAERETKTPPVLWEQHQQAETSNELLSVSLSFPCPRLTSHGVVSTSLPMHLLY